MSPPARNDVRGLRDAILAVRRERGHLERLRGAAVLAVEAADVPAGSAAADVAATLRKTLERILDAKTLARGRFTDEVCGSPT